MATSRTVAIPLANETRMINKTSLPNNLTVWFFRYRSSSVVSASSIHGVCGYLHDELDGENQPDDGEIDLKEVELPHCHISITVVGDPERELTAYP